MIQLVLGNSYSRILGLSPTHEKGLHQALSYIVGGSAAYFSGYGIRKKSLLGKKGAFPTGLKARVVTYLIENNLNFQTIHFLEPIIGPAVEFPTAYPWQLKALQRAISQGRGTISAPTGAGKSMIIRMISQRFNLKTLIVVPSLEIKKQLVETLKDLKNVIIENIDSTSLKHIRDCDILIIDEAHHVASKTYQKLNKNVWTGITYRFFLTATPFRNDTEETLLFESIAGHVIYKLDYATAIKNNYIVPVESYFIEIPKQSTDAYTYAQAYSQLVVNNDIRNDIIATLLNSLHKNDIFTLCLVREVAHGKILSDMSGAPFVSGADDDSRQFIRQFNSGGIKTLIGTTGVLGEGIDTKPAEFIIIAGLGKAKSQFMQQVGRGVRTYPGKESAKIVLFYDKSHKFTSRHFKEQAKICKEEYGIVPIKLEGL